jgi:hypothetical protein
MGDDEVDNVENSQPKLKNKRSSRVKIEKTGEKPSTVSAFTGDGFPNIGKIPFDPSLISSVHQKICGKYMFDENLVDKDFNRDDYYERNRKNAWSIVVATRQKPDVLFFERHHGRSEPFKNKNPAAYVTYISALWQSQCGRYVMLPQDPHFVLPNDESEAKKIFFPSKNWVEWMTINNTKEKYNVRNGKKNL